MWQEYKIDASCQIHSAIKVLSDQIIRAESEAVLANECHPVTNIKTGRGNAGYTLGWSKMKRS